MAQLADLEQLDLRGARGRSGRAWALEGGDDGTTETADVTFDYVAAESHDNGTLFFKSDPQSGTLDLRVGGFTDP